MEIKLSRSDVLWSYIAQFFNVGAGIITLPLILHMLSTEEIAMNYLMLVIGDFVAMVDFGFSPQFSRNISYVYSGANELAKEGIIKNSICNFINYHLLKVLIEVAHNLYKYMALIVLAVMLTLGSLYIYVATEGFTLVKNSFTIWLLYSLSVFFNIYYLYYSSLLIGRGLIMEAKKAMIASKIAYIIIAYVLILFGWGLLGVCLANLLSPFICRWLSYYYFFDKETKRHILNEKSETSERWTVFKTIWYNARKTGLSLIGGAVILKCSLFIMGLYLTLEEVSSYGLMMQFVGLIAAVSASFCTTLAPRLTSLCVVNDNNQLARSFSWGLLSYYFLFFIGAFILFAFGNMALSLIGSNATLPSNHIVILYIIVIFLEYNHALFLIIVNIGNVIPQYKAVIISGICICIGDVLILQYTHLGILGIVLIQGLVQLLYQNWKWPLLACKQLRFSYISIVKLGLEESFTIINQFIDNKKK